MGGLSMYCSTVHTVHTLSVCVYMSDDDMFARSCIVFPCTYVHTCRSIVGVVYVNAAYTLETCILYCPLICKYFDMDG